MFTQKRWLLTILLGICFIQAIFLPVKSVCAAENDPYYQRVKDSGELIVGLSADYPPYEFHETIDGKDQIVGMDIKVAERIAESLGVKLVIKEMGFDALIGALKTNKIDAIISGIAVTPERLKEIDFTLPYMEVQQWLVVRKGDETKYNTTKDFNGVPIGAQKSTTQEELANNETVGAKVVSLQKLTDAMQQLETRKVDAVIAEGPVAEAYIKAFPDKFVNAEIQFENGSKQTAIAIPKNAPVLKEKLDAAVSELRQSGDLNAFHNEASDLMFDSDQTFLEKYGDYFVKGTGYTILLALVGVLFGATGGSLLALMKLSKSRWLRWPATVYIEYVRGTPLIVQIFLVFFGTTVFNLEVSQFMAGCIALSLNSSAYVAEIIRAGINAVNKGQVEAARSLGMTQGKAMRYIVFPQAIKNILPALGNEFVTVIKESSVVSVIGVAELMFQAGAVQGASMKFFLPYFVVSLIYFVLTFTLSRLLGVAERRLHVSD